MTTQDKAVTVVFFVNFLIALINIADAIREIKKK